VKTIKMTMPDEMAKEFWNWWLGGGGEDVMWECVDFTYDNNIQSTWNSNKLTVDYYLSPQQLELEL